MYINKFVALYLLIAINSKLFSQIKKEEDSIVYLKEVVVSKSTNQPTAAVKTNGTGNESVGIYEKVKYVSLLKNIPISEITSISLFLNLKGFKKGTKFELELLILDKDSDDKPGNSVINKNIRFKIKGNKKQKIDLDLSELSIQSKSELFIGFETINLPKGGTLVLQMKKNKDGISFAKQEDGDWFVPKRQNLELNYVLHLKK
jgi:hypothetical protein